jgi:hypothetical protein
VSNGYPDAPRAPKGIEIVNGTDETNIETFEGPLIDVVIESWRFSRTFGRVLSKLDAGEVARYQSQLRFYLKRLDEALATAGLRIVNLEGQAYDTGMAATALNIADFAPEDVLFVEQMVEPVIMGEDGLRRTGTIMLKRVGL